MREKPGSAGCRRCRRRRRRRGMRPPWRLPPVCRSVSPGSAEAGFGQVPGHRLREGPACEKGCLDHARADCVDAEFRPISSEASILQCGNVCDGSIAALRATSSKVRLVPLADTGTSVGAPFSALQGDLLHRTSSILISYRHGPLLLP
jgi:hypothetical protein